MKKFLVLCTMIAIVLLVAPGASAAITSFDDTGPPHVTTATITTNTLNESLDATTLTITANLVNTNPTAVIMPFGLVTSLETATTAGTEVAYVIKAMTQDVPSVEQPAVQILANG